MTTLFVTGWSHCCDAGERPNIVFILADDMGYGDAHCNNSESKIPTPSLDRMAAEGMTFTDAHSPSAVCTPTRYGIVTGRYCWRSRLKSGVLNGYGKPLIEKDRPTVATMLQGAGYKTAAVGKWHLGLGFAPLPADADGTRYRAGAFDWKFDYSTPITHGPHILGFDYSYIIPASLDFPPYIFIQDGQVVDLPTVEQPAQRFPRFLRRGERSPLLSMENCLDDLTHKAEDYVKRQAKTEQPFFLYFPLTAPHKPAWPHSRFAGKSGQGPYGDFVIQVDSVVGRIVGAVDRAGIAKNTVIFYSSDNGSYMHRYGNEEKDHVDDPTKQGYRPEHHTANYIFRGTKADIWEAGHHVPFFARWPNGVRSGSTCNETVCLVDLFATFAEIVGAKLADNTAEDSTSLLPLLTEKGAFDRPPVIHHSAAGMFAIRDGRWKLVAGNGSGGREAPRGKPFKKPYMLFDMQNDPREQHNIATENPGVVERLTARLNTVIAGE